MLYPRPSETREVMDLSGIWRFLPDYEERGRAERWGEAPLPKEGREDMPVPSSYNDLTVSARLRDHIGAVYYERTFFVPAAWRDRRVDLRFEAASHEAVVFLNGVEVMRHKGGFLPFAADVSKQARYGEENRVTVEVRNVLDWQSLPPGEIILRNEAPFPPGTRFQDIHFDFFNYAGLIRPVRLLCSDPARIEAVKIDTDFTEAGGRPEGKNEGETKRGTDRRGEERAAGKTEGRRGRVSYDIASTAAPGTRLALRCLDRDGTVVAEIENAAPAGAFDIENVQLWEPGAAYLYTLEMSLFGGGAGTEKLLDRYRLPFGVRTVSFSEKEFFVNGRPFRFKGFGKHEDMDLKGRAHDDAMNVRDFNLLDWIGANSFRTSHYPYSEEILNLADERGVVVIDEVAAVGMRTWSSSMKVFSEERVNGASLQHHLETVTDLILRDRNHPSVVMWSLANEPDSQDPGAEAYFEKVFAHARALDKTRPLTLVECSAHDKTVAARFADILCINRYPAWYSFSGRLELIESHLGADLRQWHEKFRKPVLLAEFGADTVAGFHSLPESMFSEEFQEEYLRIIMEDVLDRLDFVVGEHIWNFADFATKQGINRFGGNKKGVFTRQRQPKAAAHYLRRRWRVR